MNFFNSYSFSESYFPVTVVDYIFLLIAWTVLIGAIAVEKVPASITEANTVIKNLCFIFSILPIYLLKVTELGWRVITLFDEKSEVMM